jgi:gluconate 2-dehydrogenase gamma chain
MDAERRELLKQAAALFAGLSISRCKPAAPVAPDAAMPDAAPLESKVPERAFLPLQRVTIAAAVARILPTDQEPGAHEANVIEYIDRELARPEYERLKKAIVGGTVALDRNAARYGGKKFADLPEIEQDDIIRQVQQASERGQDFVKFLVLLTLEGFGSDPKYFGNANAVGWQFIGYGPGQHEHH